MIKFDLIVIGSGSGLDVANAAAQHGLKVAIIEKDKMGGTCLNRGCIPSKLLLQSAEVVKILQKASIFGIDIQGFSVNYKKIVDRVNEIIDPDSAQIRISFDNLENPKLFPSACKFVGQNEIQVGVEIISADKILIACGSRPSIPDIPGLPGSGYITSNEALRFTQLPHTITIIGGGFIACELGYFFGMLGTKVNIIQRRELLLANEDEDISKKITESFSKKFNVYTGYDPFQVSKNGNIFSVKAKKSEKIIELESDQLLIATGRTPNTDALDLGKTGVKINEKGHIIVDEFLETSSKGIFALGDAAGRYPFKHSANHEVDYAYTNIVEPIKTAVDYTAMPHAVFCSPQVATVGLTEQELRKNGTVYLKSVYPYIDTAMGQAIDDNEGFVKFLVEKETRKILGCHIMGTDASVLIHQVLTAMRSADGTVDSLTNTIFIHPALSEVISSAAYAIE